MRARQGQDPGATSWYALIWNYTLQKYKNTQYKIKEYKSATVQKYKNTKVLNTKTQVDMRPFKTTYWSAVQRTVLDRESADALQSGGGLCRAPAANIGRRISRLFTKPGVSPQHQNIVMPNLPS